jgi:hypothetical protein
MKEGTEFSLKIDADTAAPVTNLLGLIGTTGDAE